MIVELKHRPQSKSYSKPSLCAPSIIIVLNITCEEKALAQLTTFTYLTNSTKITNVLV